MTLRRLFSCLLLALAALASIASRHAPVPVAGTGDPPDGMVAPADPATPSPYLAGSVRAGTAAGMQGGGDGRSLLRRTRGGLSRVADDVAHEDGAPASRIRSTLTSLSEALPALAESRTGQRSARSTALPPPLDT